MKKLLSIVILLALVILVSCEALNEPTVEKFSVEYKCTGSANKVNLTIENTDGGTSQFSKVSLPWSYRFSSKKEAGTFVYVSAQNQGSSGNVTVTILKDNKTFKTSTSSGAYVIASASGSL